MRQEIADLADAHGGGQCLSVKFHDCHRAAKLADGR